MVGLAAIGIADQAVADGVGGRVGVAGVGGDADGGAVGGVLCDLVGAGVAVVRRGHVGFVDVADGDREGSHGAGAVRRAGLDVEGAAGTRLAVDAAGDGDDAARGVDRELARTGSAAIGIADQAVADGVGGRIGVAGGGGDADGGADGGVLGDLVGADVAVARRGHAEFVDVVDAQRDGFLGLVAGVVGCDDGEGIKALGFVIRISGQLDLAGLAVDAEGRCIFARLQAVADRLGEGVAGLGRVDHLASAAVLVQGRGRRARADGRGNGVERDDAAADGDVPCLIAGADANGVATFDQFPVFESVAELTEQTKRIGGDILDDIAPELFAVFVEDLDPAASFGGEQDDWGHAAGQTVAQDDAAVSRAAQSVRGQSGRYGIYRDRSCDGL